MWERRQELMVLPVEPKQDEFQTLLVQAETGNPEERRVVLERLLLRENERYEALKRLLDSDTPEALTTAGTDEHSPFAYLKNNIASRLSSENEYEIADNHGYWDRQERIDQIKTWLDRLGFRTEIRPRIVYGTPIRYDDSQDAYCGEKYLNANDLNDRFRCEFIKVLAEGNHTVEDGRMYANGKEVLPGIGYTYIYELIVKAPLTIGNKSRSLKDCPNIRAEYLAALGLG